MFLPIKNLFKYFINNEYIILPSVFDKITDYK